MQWRLKTGKLYSIDVEVAVVLPGVDPNMCLLPSGLVRHLLSLTESVAA